MKYNHPKLINILTKSILVMGILFATTAKARFTGNGDIHYLNDTAANFNGVVNKFKGKIIYVDIWASWCGPCKHELRINKDINNFRAFAEKNRIIVLYICCDYNDKIWREFITQNKLTGYHILINRHIDNDFHTVFSSVQNRNGKMKRSFYIPRHLIVDRNGMVVDSTADRQNSKSVYDRLNKLLRDTLPH